MRSCPSKSVRRCPATLALVQVALTLALVSRAEHALGQAPETQIAPANLGAHPGEAVTAFSEENPKPASTQSAVGEPSAGSLNAARESGASGVVNVNTATREELMRLRGVGPTRADAVLALRARLKRFHRLEDLMRVRGIGRQTFRRLLPMLRLSGETTLTQVARGCRDVKTRARRRTDAR